MEEQKRKRITLFVVGLFVVAGFVSSIAAYGNNQTNTTSTSTIPKNYAVFGTVSGNVTGYARSVTIDLGNSSNSTVGDVTTLLNVLKGVGGIANFSVSNSSISTELLNTSAYSLQQGLLNTTNGSVSVSGTEYVLLPKTVTLYFYGTAVNVNVPSRNLSFSVTPLKPVGAGQNVSISAIVTSDGSVYNNQISVSLSK